MKKLELGCCKITNHNPYIEEDNKVISENIFVVNGYSVSKLLEDVLFNINFNIDGSIISIIPENIEWFEDNFNSVKWYEEIRKKAEYILSKGDQVEIPNFLKDKYYLDDSYVSYIKIIEEEKFNYFIARKYDNSEQLCVYAYGREIHFGTKEEAEFLRDYVMKQKESEGKEYKIYYVGN